MKVMAGYKQTEVGIIPEEWENITVQNLVNENVLAKPLDGNHGSIHPKSSDYVHYGIPFVMANNFTNGKVDFGSCKFITKERADKLQKGFSISGDVLLTHKGTIGNTAIVGELSTEYIMLTPQVTYYRVIDSTRLSNCYLRQYFDSQPFQSLFKSLAGGGTRAYLGIVKQLALPVVVPPLPEQRAIAEALSDTDTLLEGLDRLIAKNRNLKQAAMQQLLTGQTRLPGFIEEWEQKTLGNHVTFLRNGVNSRAELRPEGRVKYLHYGDIHACTDVFISPNSLPCLPDVKSVSLGRLCDGDLIFADASEDLTGVSKSVEMREVGNTVVVPGLHTIAARFDKAVLADGFKGFLQFCPPFARHLRRLAAGTKVYATNRAHIASVEIRLPGVAEQVAIAAVLSDMDAALVALEARRDKTRDLKQAMMQELLTGKTRLI